MHMKKNAKTLLTVVAMGTILSMLSGCAGPTTDSRVCLRLQTEFASAQADIQKQCDEKLKEAEIDFSSGMAVRELRELAQQQALESTVAQMIEQKILNGSVHIESKEDVVKLFGHDKTKIARFDQVYKQQEAIELQALRDRMATQINTVKADIQRQCEEEMKALKTKFSAELRQNNCR